MPFRICILRKDSMFSWKSRLHIGGQIILYIVDSCMGYITRFIVFRPKYTNSYVNITFIYWSQMIWTIYANKLGNRGVLRQFSDVFLVCTNVVIKSSKSPACERIWQTRFKVSHIIVTQLISLNLIWKIIGHKIR